MKLNFEDALSLVKSGYRIRRIEWQNMQNNYRDYIFMEMINNKPKMTLKDTTGHNRVWMPNSEDLFANDWEIAKD